MYKTCLNWLTLYSCFVSRCLSKAMQMNADLSWNGSWSTGVSARSFPRSSLPTQHPLSWCFSTKTWWHPYTLTVLMSFSCCSQRSAWTQMKHSEEIQYVLSSPVAVTPSTSPHSVWFVPVAEWIPSCVFGEDPFAGVGPRSSLRLRARPWTRISYTFPPFHQTLDLASTPPFPWSLQWLPASSDDQ